MTHRYIPYLMALIWVGAAAAACSGSGDLGSACSGDSECETDFCLAGECKDGAADQDEDGLGNRLERDLGLSPRMADSDRDGVGDGAEVSLRTACLGDDVPQDDLPETCEALPSDCDCDGRVDALESAERDVDLDGVPDQFDPEDGPAYCGQRTLPRPGPAPVAWQPRTRVGGCLATQAAAAGSGGSAGRQPVCIVFECVAPPTCAGEAECASGEECQQGRCVRPAPVAGDSPDAGSGAVGTDAGGLDAGGADGG